MASKANVGNIYEKILCEAQICKQFLCFYSKSSLLKYD